MGVASLVLGIVSIVFALVPGLSWIGGIAGIVGIILGAMGRKDPDTAKMATAGLVMSIIGVALGVITYIACVACLRGVTSALEGLQ